MKSGFLNLILLLVITCSSQANAQEDILELREKEFGFNSTPFITSLLPFETNPTFNTDDFFLIHKKRIGLGVYRRIAMAIRIDSFNESTANGILLKYGREKKMPLTKSWIFHAGTEIFAGIGSFSSLNFRAELGLTGLYGIQWKINDRIGLGTEGYFVFSLLNEERAGSDANGLSVKFKQPKSLLFSIYF